MKISVIITLKKDVLDPQGKVIHQTMDGMGFNNISEVRQGKYIKIDTKETDKKIAQEKLAESEHRLREQNEIMRSDYESAEKVQSVMIPGRVPQIKNVDIAHLWKPMTMVGGDIINFPRNPDNRLVFFMGDVCGHGVTAAFYTVLIK